MKISDKIYGIPFEDIIAFSCAFTLYISLYVSFKTGYRFFALLMVFCLNISAGKKIIPLIITGFFAAVLILFSVQNENKAFYSLIEEEKISAIQGVIASTPVPTGADSYSFILNVEYAGSIDIKSSAIGKTTVYIKSEFVEKPASRKLARQQNKAVFVEQGGRLFFSGKYHTATNSFYAEKAVFICWNNRIAKIRALMRQRLKLILLSWGEAGGLLLALLTGCRDFVPVQIRDNFTRTGIAHILALSGMHMSIIGDFVRKLFKPGLGRQVSSILTVIAGGFFLWFAGISPSLLRAFLCLSFSVFFELIGTNVKKTTVLALSFIVQLILYSGHAAALSFLLSYTGLGGIYMFSAYFRYLYTRYLRLPEKLAESLAVSTAAQTGILPVSILCLKQIVPVGIFTTLCVSPFISLFFILGIFGIMFSLVSESLGVCFSYALRIIYAIICRIIEFFSIFQPINL